MKVRLIFLFVLSLSWSYSAGQSRNLSLERIIQIYHEEAISTLQDRYNLQASSKGRKNKNNLKRFEKSKVTIDKIITELKVTSNRDNLTTEASIDFLKAQLKKEFPSLGEDYYCRVFEALNEAIARQFSGDI